MKHTLRTLWAIVLALGLGLAAQAQQQVNNFRVLTNLYVGNAITGVTLNGYNIDAVVTNSATAVATIFVQNLQALLETESPAVPKLAYVLNDGTAGDGTKGTYRFDPDLSGGQTATVFIPQDKHGSEASLGRWVRMSAGDNYQMSVDTLDDALAVTPAYLAAGINPTNSIKLTVKTRARKTLGKKGAATYYYSASAPATTNLGTILPYGSGYLLWDGETALTPQLFGAVADGSTDDWAPLQAAVTYAAANKLRLTVPPGTYSLSKPIVITSGPFSITGHDGQKANAASGGSANYVSEAYFKLANSANTNVLWITTNGFVSISGIAFDGNRANQSGTEPTVKIDGGTYPMLFFQDCNFVNGAGDGVNIVGRSEIIFLRCKALFNNGDGIDASSTPFDITADYLHAGFNRGRGIAISGGRSIRLWKPETYFNQLEGLVLDNFADGELFYLTSNDNGREALRFDTYAGKVRLIGGLLKGANRWGSTEGEWTNAAATGTYPLVSFNDAGNPTGVYDIDFLGTTFTGLSGTATNGLPSYILADNRTNATARDGYGIRLIGGSLPPSGSWVTNQLSANLPGKLTLSSVYNFNGFKTENTQYGEATVITAPTSFTLAAGVNYIGGAATFTNAITSLDSIIVRPTADATNTLAAFNDGAQYRFRVDTLNDKTYVIGPDGETTDPSFNSGTVLVVKNNAFTSSRSRVAIVGGSAGFSTIEMGSALNYGLQVDETNTRLNIQQGGSTPIRVRSARVAMSNGTIADPEGAAVLDLQSTDKGLQLPRPTADPSGAVNGLIWYGTNAVRAYVQGASRDVAVAPTTTALSWSGTNITLTATAVLTQSEVTLTNSPLFTISAADGLSGGVTFKPHASNSYTVYLDSAIKLLGGSTSFVVTNSSTETVNLEWKQTTRGGSSVILANKAVYP